MTKRTTKNMMARLMLTTDLVRSGLRDRGLAHLLIGGGLISVLPADDYQATGTCQASLRFQAGVDCEYELCAVVTDDRTEWLLEPAQLAERLIGYMEMVSANCRKIVECRRLVQTAVAGVVAEAAAEGVVVDVLAIEPASRFVHRPPSVSERLVFDIRTMTQDQDGKPVVATFMCDFDYTEELVATMRRRLIERPDDTHDILDERGRLVAA